MWEPWKWNSVVKCGGIILIYNIGKALENKRIRGKVREQSHFAIIFQFLQSNLPCL